MPPKEVLYHLVPVPFVAGIILLATWPWRKRAWPAGLALAAAYGTGAVLLEGVPAGWPSSLETWLLPLALLGLAVAAFEPDRLWLKLGLRLVASALAVGLLLSSLEGAPWKPIATFDNPDPGPPSTMSMVAWHAGLALALFGLWTGLDWRARAVKGFVMPAGFWMAGAGAAGALVFAHSAKLSEHGAFFAAASGALIVVAFLPGFRQEFGVHGAAGVFALAFGGLMITGYFLGDVLPPTSAILLAGAPLLAMRKWWLGLGGMGAAVGLALYLAYAANPAGEYAY
ncbi:MAG: hypothetical protein ACYTGN_08645 [Planctomycetota bacterium]|jgi:hypothetical protein